LCKVSDASLDGSNYFRNTPALTVPTSLVTQAGPPYTYNLPQELTESADRDEPDDKGAPPPDIRVNDQ